MKKYSYTEAYTNYINYCEKRLNIPFAVLVEKYKSNGVEKQFREIYTKNSIELTNAQYYNELKGV